MESAYSRKHRPMTEVTREELGMNKGVIKKRLHIGKTLKL